MAVTERSPLPNGLVRTRHLELQAARPSRARRLRRHGRRHVDPDRARRPPHPVAGARERAEEFHRRRRLRSAQAQGGGADRPAAGAHALELARDLRQHHGGRLPDPEEGPAAGRLRAVRHLGAGEAEVDLVLRLLGPDLARRAPALVLRRRIRPHARPARPTSSRRIRSTTSSTAASTCAIRRSRSRSAAGGCPAPSRATT